MLSSSQLSGNEDMLPSLSDPNISMDVNLSFGEGSELDDSYDLGEKLPFDDEMEVDLTEDKFLSTAQFSDPLRAPTQTISKKTPVNAVKQAGKRKSWSRRVSMNECFLSVNCLYKVYI